MSGSRRTYDTDQLVIRQVTALDQNNAVRPANTVLTADGAGGTYWAIPCTLGALPSYNTITADGIQMPANMSTNTLNLVGTSGVGLDVNSNTKTVTFFGTSFTQFDISGGNTLVAYSNQIATPTVTFVGKNGINVSADPLTNTFFIQGTPASISTGIYGYSQLNVISNASTITNDAINNTNNQYLTATSPSTVLKMIGVGDIILNTNTTSNAMFISISSFTSQGWADLSGVAHSTFDQVMSTVSSLYYDNNEVSSVTSTLTASLSNYSVAVQDKFEYDTTYVQYHYLTKGEFYSFSNTVELQIGTLEVISNSNTDSINAINSTVNTLYQDFTTSSLTVTSSFYLKTTPSGDFGSLTVSSSYWLLNGENMSTSAIGSNEFNSTVAGIASNISSFIDPIELTSTVVGLATSGIISTSGLLSTVSGLGSSGYVSSTGLHSTTQQIATSNIPSTVTGIVASLVSTTSNIATYNIPSTIAGLGTYGYVSSTGLHSTTQQIATSNIPSTVTGIVVSLVSTTSNIVLFNIPSTIAGLGTYGYVSSSQLASTVCSLLTYISSFIDPTELTSSVIGLATSGIVSTSGMLSTIAGLGTYGYVSSTGLHSTTQQIATSNIPSTVTGIVASLVSTTSNIVLFNIPSTIAGLGTYGYVSSTGLHSTTQQIATSNIPSTVTGIVASLVSTTSNIVLFNIPSTIAGLGTYGYVSSTGLHSTTQQIATSNIPSTVTGIVASLVSTTSNIATYNIPSTIAGLGQLGYISSATAVQGGLTSSLAGLGNLGYVSSTGLHSTTQQIATSNIPSTVTGIVASLVSTTRNIVSFNIPSTIAGLGSLGYISSFAQIGASSIMASTISASSVTTRVAWVDTINASSISTYSMTVYGQNTLTVQGGFFTSSVNIQDSAGGYANITVAGGVINVKNPDGNINVQLVTDNYLISSFAGLGLIGYISTASLRSSLQGLGLVGYLSTAVLSNNLASTTAGLGSLRYISSQQLVSTTIGLSNYISTFIDTNELTSTVIGLATSQYVSTTGLFSTVQGLGSAGYISSATLISTVAGLNSNISSMIDPTELTSTVVGLATQGFLSTSGLTSTVSGLGTSGYISTASLRSSLQGLGLVGYLSTAVLSNNLASTTAGLGSLGYVSSTQLFSTTVGIVASNLPSTVAGLGTFGYVSSLSNVLSLSTQRIQTSSLSSFYINTGTLNFTNILSNGTNWIPNANWIRATSTAIVIGCNAALTNQGVGAIAIGNSAGFSYQSTNSIAIGNNAANTSQNMNAVAIGFQAGCLYQGEGSVVIGQLTGFSNNPGGIYTNSNYIAIGRSAGYSNQSTNSIAIGWLAGSNNTAEQSIILNASGSVLNSSNAGFYVDPVRSIASPNIAMYNTTTNEFTYVDASVYVSSAAIASTVAGLGLVGYISTASLTSSLRGLGLVGYLSTAVLSNNLASTTAGLGSLGYVSTATDVTSSIRGLGAIGYVSSTQLFSTTVGIVASNLPSTVAGLGTFGYVSSLSNVLSLSTQRIQTSSLSSFYINTGTLNFANILSNGTTWVPGNGYVSLPVLTSSIVGLGAIGYVSSTQLFSTTVGIVASNLPSTVAGLGNSRYVSSLSNVLSLSTQRIQTSSLSSFYINTGTLNFANILSNGSPVVFTTPGINSAGNIGINKAAGSVALDVNGNVTAKSLNMGRLVVFPVTANNYTITQLSGGNNWGYIFADFQKLGDGIHLSYNYFASNGVVYDGAGTGTAGLANGASRISIGYGSIGLYTGTSDPLIESLYIGASGATTIKQLTVTGATTLNTLNVTGAIILGNSVYVSSTQLFSTTVGIVASNLPSTVAGLGTLGYVSSTQLFSTTVGIVASNLPSTVAGLGTFGYVSSLSNVLSLSTQRIQTSSLSSFYINTGSINFANILSNGTTWIPTGNWLGATSTAIVIGCNAASTLQGVNAIAIGNSAGQYNQSTNSIAIGNGAGYSNQNINAIAIGTFAGYSSQSTNSIAIGWLAGSNTTAQSSIILNASGNAFNTSTAGLFVRPVRGNLNLNTSLSTNANNPLVYNTETGEISYASSLTVSSLFANGDIYAVGNVTAFSDRRLKENIVTILNPLSTLNNLRGVSYTRNDLPNSTLKYIGVIAQEVEAVLPEVVFTGNDERETKSVSYGNMVALLIESVKEQDSKISSLTYFYDAQTSNLSSLTSSYDVQTCKMSSLTSSYELLTQHVSTLIGSQRYV